jgi:hypothetical protein
LFLGRRTLSLVVKASLLAAGLAPALPAHAAGPADPVPTCIAENERSLELRKAGDLLGARRELAACAAAPCPEAIQQACRSRIPELNAAIPSVVFDVRDATGADLTDVTIAIDGQPAEAAGFTARPVNPGRRVFHFEAPGRRTVEKALVLREGEKDRRESAVMGPAEVAGTSASTPESPGSAGSPGSPVSAGTTTPAVAEARPHPTSGLRTAGWVVGGTGIVAMVAGGTIALVARSSYENAPGCSGTVCATQPGLDARNSARATGDVATVVFVAGAAATAVGVVLWIVGRSTTDTAAIPAWRVGMTPAGAVAEGSF